MSVSSFRGNIKMVCNIDNVGVIIYCIPEEQKYKLIKLRKSGHYTIHRYLFENCVSKCHYVILRFNFTISFLFIILLNRTLKLRAMQYFHRINLYLRFNLHFIYLTPTLNHSKHDFYLFTNSYLIDDFWRYVLYIVSTISVYSRSVKATNYKTSSNLHLSRAQDNNRTSS